MRRKAVPERITVGGCSRVQACSPEGLAEHLGHRKPREGGASPQVLLHAPDNQKKRPWGHSVVSELGAPKEAEWVLHA